MAPSKVLYDKSKATQLYTPQYKMWNMQNNTKINLFHWFFGYNYSVLLRSIFLFWPLLKQIILALKARHLMSILRVFLNIVAYLPVFFFLILNTINRKMILFIFEHVNTRKHASEHSRLSGWVILNILAHLAHLAQSYFSLIFSATTIYNCF